MKTYTNDPHYSTALRNVCLLTWLVLRSKLIAAPLFNPANSQSDSAIAVDSFAHPDFEGQYIYFYHKENVETRRPVVLFIHGIGATDPRTYQGLIYSIVNHGNSLIYTNYSSMSAAMHPQTAYQQMWSGIESGMAVWESYIDKSQIGFVGHSYGGGAIPALAQKALGQKHWGKRGCFLYLMAPWYSCEISNLQLRCFPSKTKMVMQIFENDDINDHRMAVHLFKTIGVPDSAKDFVTVPDERVDGTLVEAGHSLACGIDTPGSPSTQVRSMAIYRLVNALADYTFEKAPAARSIALGNNSPDQRTMGYDLSGKVLTDLQVTDAPCVSRPQSSFLNFWSHAMNPHARFARLFGPTIGLAMNTPRTLVGYLAYFAQSE